MAKSKYIDRDNLYSDRMDADSGGEEFMGGQAEPAGGIAGLPPEIAAAIAQLMSAQAAGAPAKVAPGMVAGEAAGIPELLAAPAATAPLTTTSTTTEAYNAAKTAADRALAMAVKRESVDLRYDVNKDGKVTSADALSLSKGNQIRSDIDAFGAKPTTTDVGALSTNRVTESSAPVSAPAAPVAASQAPTAKEIRDGVGKDGQVAALSQTQGYGMVPVYEAQQGRGADRGEPVLMGYEFNPIAAGLTTVDTPKPAAILAEEKRLGKEMEPTYATYTAPQEGSDRGNRESIAYGPPTGYRYDNGQSQYVKFDSSGKYYETEQRKGEYDDALKMAALFAASATGGASLGLGAGAGAGAAGAGAAGTAAFSPQMIAAGMAPGAAGATGAVSGALTGANLAAASGIGSLGAGALTGVVPSLNQLAASGMGPGSYGALNLPALEAAVAAGSIAPEALAAAQLAATGTTGAGITSLAPLASELSGPPSTPGTPPPPNLELPLPPELPIPSGPPSTPGTPPPPNLELPPPIDAPIPSGPPSTPGTPPPPDVGPPGTNLEPPIPSGPPSTPGTPPPPDVGPPGTNIPPVDPGIKDLLKKGKDALIGSGSGSGSGMGVLGLLALMSMMNRGGGAAPASTATIPELTATRSQLPYDVDKKGVNPNTPYRPGQGGVTYFSPTTYTPTPAKAAGGGLMSLGQSNLGSYSDGGRLLKGPGDGVSDSIPAIIGRKQPARLANGEFVIPARIVSELGNGSTDAGAKRLYEMMARVQKARRNTKNVAANTKAAKYLPA